MDQHSACIVPLCKGSVLGGSLFLLYTSELFSISENKPIGYADDYFDGYCA